MKVFFNSNVKECKEAVTQAMARALEICGGKAESYAKQICPVDTGNLRNSITHEQIDEKTEVIGTTVEYAPYVELGTARMKPRPYLRPAAENHSDEYRNVISSELAKIK